MPKCKLFKPEIPKSWQKPLEPKSMPQRDQEFVRCDEDITLNLEAPRGRV